MADPRIDVLRRSLAVPGEPVPSPPGRRRAAVLLLLDPSPAGLPLLFVRRAEFLRRHPGQIGFPGGAAEAADADIVATALREAREEVGLDPGNVEVAGSLPARLTHTSELWLTPVVGVQRHPFTVRGDGHEVAETFWLTLDGLLASPHSAAIAGRGTTPSASSTTTRSTAGPSGASPVASFTISSPSSRGSGRPAERRTAACAARLSGAPDRG